MIRNIFRRKKRHRDYFIDLSKLKNKGIISDVNNINNSPITPENNKDEENSGLSVLDTLASSSSSIYEGENDKTTVKNLGERFDVLSDKIYKLIERVDLLEHKINRIEKRIGIEIS